MAPRILIFSIAMGADYSSHAKSIATYTPAFLRYNNSVLAIVNVFQMFIVLGMYNFADDTNHDIQSRDAPKTKI